MTSPASTAAPSPTRRSRLGLLRQPDFAKLWVGDTISQFGSQVSLIAIPIIGATVLGVSPQEFALLGFFEFLPFILISLPAGVWVDRLRRRPILISGDLVRAVSLLSIPIAYQLGVLTVWQLYVVGFVNGIATVFFDVSYQSYLPSIVERDEIVEGNGKLQASQAAAQLVGPGLGGVLIGIVTAPIAVIADSISFIASAAMVFLIRRSEPPIERHAEGKRPSIATEARAGLAYVTGNPYLRMIAGATGVANLFSNILFSILILYLVRNLGLSPTQIGLIFSVGAIGPLIGAFVTNRLANIFGVGPTITFACFLGGPSALLVAIAPASQDALPFLVVSMAIGQFGGIVYNINQVSFRQAITPPRMQGRMNASMRFIVWGTIPLGQVVGGAIATVWGLQSAIWVGAIGAFLPFLFVLFSPVRTLRTMPAPVDDEGPATSTTRADVVSEALSETAEPVGASAPVPRHDVE